MTSNRALQKARRLLGSNKAGHTGTLDPLASGLLILCFGRATAFAQSVVEQHKTYLATLQLGQSTDTYDAEGKILSQSEVTIDDEAIGEALEKYTGPQLQIPPMYSALKHQGKPLYQLARRGIDVERQPRPVEIFELTFISRTHTELQICVHCSKGTYIRTLAHDLGKYLGCGAHLKELIRKAVGKWSLDQAIDLKRLEMLTLEERISNLQPMDDLLGDLKSNKISQDAALMFVQGRPQPNLNTPQSQCRVYGPQNQFLGLGQCQDGVLKPLRVVALPM